RFALTHIEDGAVEIVNELMHNSASHESTIRPYRPAQLFLYSSATIHPEKTMNSRSGKKPRAARFRDGRMATRGVEFGHRRLQIRLDGDFFQAQGRGDLGVARAQCGARQYVGFAR